MSLYEALILLTAIADEGAEVYQEEYDNGNVIPEYKMLDTRTVDQLQGEDYGEQG
jgi:hypothetical protein